MGKKRTHNFVLFCDRIQVYCDAVTSKMMIDHYFVDRFFRVRTFSWAEFDERSEEGSRNIVRTRKYHTTLNYWDNKNFWGAKSGPLTHASSVKVLLIYLLTARATRRMDDICAFGIIKIFEVPNLAHPLLQPQLNIFIKLFTDSMNYVWTNCVLSKNVPWI